MELVFENYVSTTVLDTKGTVMNAVGADGSIELIEKNFADLSKRVAVILKKKNGTSLMVSCSKAVSEGLRNKTINKEHLFGFEILVGESDVPFISLPGGGNNISIAAKDIVVKDYVVTNALTFEDLIA